MFVQLEMTLDTAIEAIPAGSEARKTFVAGFKADVAALLSVPAARVEVLGVRGGSVVVDYKVRAPPADAAKRIADAKDAGTPIAGAAVEATREVSVVESNAEPVKPEDDRIDAPKPPPAPTGQVAGTSGAPSAAVPAIAMAGVLVAHLLLLLETW